MSKGSNFERELCKQISLWWSDGASDAVFWRTSNSGGRATVRGRKGKQTTNQAGDLCAIDPVGQPFVKAITTEIKRGYSKHTLADLLDKPASAALQVYEEWIMQAEQSQCLAGAKTWLIIARRDRREAMVYLPHSRLTVTLTNDHGPLLWMVFPIQDKTKRDVELYALTLESWLKQITPVMVQELLLHG